MLPLAKLSSEPRLADLFSFKFLSIATDWFEQPAAAAPAFLLAVSPSRLLFAARVAQPANCDMRNPGDYIEGLWKKDAAELFFCEDGAAAYQEINLSPAGAWWTCAFTGVRQRDPAFKKPAGVEVKSSLTPESWQAACAIPLAALNIKASWTEATRANVCFVLGAQTQHYYSWAKLLSAEPDFHRPHEFARVKPTARSGA